MAGYTPLMWAAYRGHAKTVELLLETFDGNGDGVLTKRELRRRPDLYVTMDDDRSSVIEADELERSSSRVLVRGLDTVLDDFLDSVEDHRMTACAWAGGDWWGDYVLSLQPRDGREVAPLRAMVHRQAAARR